MKTIYKLLFAGLLCFSTLTATAVPDPDDITGANSEVTGQDQGSRCPAKRKSPIKGERIIFELPNGFVAIDSVECSVHLEKQKGNDFEIVKVIQTDNIKKRHDLKNILRPKSVLATDKNIFVLASAVNDKSFVAVYDLEMKDRVAFREFSTPMQDMELLDDTLIIKGHNPYGYDYCKLPIDEPSFQTFANGKVPYEQYRVKKKSEKIGNADPVGIGLTAVAVSVVFLALICIALILQGTGKLMSGMEEKKKKGANQKKGGAAVKASAAAADKEGEIYAAIATAIHLYNDELHDEEDAVITIQKVEREWTPWNAKYYNMNQYFNNRR